MPPRRNPSVEASPPIGGAAAPEIKFSNGFKFVLGFGGCAIMLLFRSSFLTIHTGEVGVVVRFGAVQNNTLLYPGLNVVNPLTSVVYHVQTSAQSDAVFNVPCLTSEGTQLVFKSIEIGNQLFPEHVINMIEKFRENYDDYLVKSLIRHQVNVICANKTTNQLAITEFEQLDDLLKDFIQSENDRQNTGLKIMFVRITKPTMPDSLVNNYLALAEEKTRKAVVYETRERQLAEKKSEMDLAQKDNEIKAEKARSENTIREEEAKAKNRMMILNMEAKKAEQSLQDEMTVATANAQSQKTKLEAEGLSALFSIPGYTQTKVAESMSSNQKIYYGEKVPTYMVTAAGNTCHATSE